MNTPKQHRNYIFNNSILRRKLFRAKNSKLFTKTRDGNIIYINRNPEFLKAFRAHFLECLDVSSYKDNATIKEALKIVLDDVRHAKLHRYEVLRVGRKNIFFGWLSDLPTILNHSYYNDDIKNVLFDFLADGKNDKVTLNILENSDTQELTDMYFYFLEEAFKSLLKDYKLKSIDELELTN